jgi:predicted HicB family RNase H-like nuclease
VARGTLNGRRAEKITLTIPASVKKSAFRHAAKKRISLSQLVTHLIAREVGNGKTR